ncbi:MAG: patatin-like phospholipase family protein [Paludibacteraceae bacterium]
MKPLKEILRLSSNSTQKEDKNMTVPTIGLCLSGGGALGYAHIGVIQALEDCGIYPQVISGASMGAVVGLVYAAGKTPQEMLQLIKDDKLYRLTNLVKLPTAFWRSSGISNHQPLKKLIKEICPQNNFDSLKLKMNVCVSNLNSGKWEVISSGNNVDEWVAASSSIPGVYIPIKMGEELYVDGGLLNNMPAQPLREQCDVIIGSDVFPQTSVKKNLKMQNAVVASIRTVQVQNSQEGRSLCKFLIEPNMVEKYHEFSFDAYKEIFQSGYSAVTKYLVEHPEMLQLRSGVKEV